MTTTQTENCRIQTIFTPGTFTPLVRIETDMTELAKAAHRTLAEKLQQDAGMTFVPELLEMLNGLEAELRQGDISAPNQQWLAQCGLTPEQMKNQMEPEYTLLRKIYLYHCDHRGLPLALINPDGSVAWRAEYDEDGSVLAVEGFQPTETQPRGFNVDHSGKYLIATGQKSHHVAVYEIAGEQGLLQEKGRYAVGQGPMWVVVNAY